jgi:protein-tyrosine phosphatase
MGDERGITIETRTAGLAHHPNRAVAEKAIAVMRELGINISDEYSKPVTADLLKWADLILLLQESHMDAFLETYPDFSVKLRYVGTDVRDPYCGSLADYREVRDVLQKLLAQFVVNI